MLPQPLEQLNEQHLRELCDDKCPESQTLEFKRDLASSSDKDKHELCKDVSAMANTDGGDIVYGIDENNGAAGALTPIKGESPDAAIRRLSQVLDAGVEPRIQGLRVRHLNLGEGYAIIIRVPTSFDGPHCVRVNNNTRRFVMRNGTTITDMSFDQVRSAFDRTATLADRARRFISDRLQLISERNTTLPLMKGAQWVVHLIPISGMAGNRTVDLKSIYPNSYAEFVNPDWKSGDRRFNIDGLLIYSAGRQDDGYYAYNHIFRNGSIEGVQFGGAQVPFGEKKLLVPSVVMSRFFYLSIKHFLLSAKTWGFAGPAMLGVAILNAKGYELAIGGLNHLFDDVSAADRSNLIPPSVWVEDIDSIEIDRTVQPLLDTLWQAFGSQRCLDFDESTGAYAPRTS